MKKILGIMLIIVSIAPFATGILGIYNCFVNFSEESAENGIFVTLIGDGITILLFFSIGFLFVWLGLKLIKKKIKIDYESNEKISQIEIIYKVKFIDVYKATLYIQTHSTTLNVWMGIVIAFIFIIIYRNLYEANDTLKDIIIEGLLLVFVIVALITVFMLIFSLFLYNPKKNKNIFTRVKTIANSKGISEETSSANNNYDWLGILKIRMVKNYIYAYISQNSAIVIPKHAFKTTDDFLIFYSYILYHWEKANKL